MSSKNYKFCIILKSVLFPTVSLIILACFLYFYIIRTILSELYNIADMILNVEILNHVILKIKYSIIIAMMLLMVSAIFILCKFAYDNSKALCIDYLTQIGSRRLFDIKLKENIKKGKIRKKGLSIMMIDIDWFKQINDKYGHDIGDLILQHVAKTIETNTRKFDICSRYGGDEFVVILPDTNVEQAKLIGKRIMENLNEFSYSIDINNIESIKVTVSMGISEWHSGMTYSEFCKSVDAALLVSKIEGRNRITLFKGDSSYQRITFEQMV